MKRILYIGQYTDGTTSKMRADTLKELLKVEMQIINIYDPFLSASRLLRSITFRYKKGPLVRKINRFIVEKLESSYDMIWVDKAIFLNLNTTKLLKQKTNKLIHYTPDTAFLGNYSKHFICSLNLYNYLITTKSFELNYYKTFLPENRIIMVSQGYNRNLHFPRHSFEEKVFGVSFIGLWEPEREKVLNKLLTNNISVYLAGKKWSSFVYRNQNPNLNYLGDSLFLDNYVEAISKTNFSLGLLSKNFPELHTTRTFEIPACGTALITERNKETESFFSDDEVIFFSSEDEIINKINYYKVHSHELKELTKKGTSKVNEKAVDYHSILSSILTQIG
jgi:spore maturation protein CgeB